MRRYFYENVSTSRKKNVKRNNLQNNYTKKGQLEIYGGTQMTLVLWKNRALHVHTNKLYLHIL